MKITDENIIEITDELSTEYEISKGAYFYAQIFQALFSILCFFNYCIGNSFAVLNEDYT